MFASRILVIISKFSASFFCCFVEDLFVHPKMHHALNSKFKSLCISNQAIHSWSLLTDIAEFGLFADSSLWASQRDGIFSLCFTKSHILFLPLRSSTNLPGLWILEAKYLHNPVVNRRRNVALFEILLYLSNRNRNAILCWSFAVLSCCHISTYKLITI